MSKKQYKRIILETKNNTITMREDYISEDLLKDLPTSFENEEFKLVQMRKGDTIFGTRIWKKEAPIHQFKLIDLIYPL